MPIHGLDFSEGTHFPQAAVYYFIMKCWLFGELRYGGTSYSPCLVPSTSWHALGTLWVFIEQARVYDNINHLISIYLVFKVLTKAKFLFKESILNRTSAVTSKSFIMNHFSIEVIIFSWSCQQLRLLNWSFAYVKVQGLTHFTLNHGACLNVTMAA